MFRSIAEAYGSKAFAVVMTGMGYDGRVGAGAHRRRRRRNHRAGPGDQRRLGYARSSRRGRPGHRDSPARPDRCGNRPPLRASSDADHGTDRTRPGAPIASVRADQARPIPRPLCLGLSARPAAAGHPPARTSESPRRPRPPAARHGPVRRNAENPTRPVRFHRGHRLPPRTSDGTHATQGATR